MFLHRLSHDSKFESVFPWYLMALSAGAVNAGGFLATGRFVTHVTGFATLFGADVVRQEWGVALGILSVPLFFLFGAFIAGWGIDRQILKKRPPHFDGVMGLSATSLLLVAFLPDIERAPTIGELIHLWEVYLVLALLCFSSGLQNAALTSSSGSSVRTTHLTGITTDLGLGLARMFYESLPLQQRRSERRTNWIRAATIGSFILGSAIGAGLFLRFGARGFLFAATLNFYGAIQGRKAKAYAHP